MFNDELNLHNVNLRHSWFNEQRVLNKAICNWFNNAAASGKGKAAASVSFTDRAAEETGTDPKTWSARSIGTEPVAGQTRHIVVGVVLRAAGTITISSVTVGGTAATQIKTINGGAPNTTSADLWIVEKPTGTTADIVVDFSGGPATHGISVWAVYDLSSATPTDSGSSSADPSTVSLNIQAGGVAICCSFAYSTGSTATSTPTELTEHFDEAAGTDGNHTGLSKAYAVAQTGLSVGVDWSGGSTRAMVVVALR